MKRLITVCMTGLLATAALAGTSQAAMSAADRALAADHNPRFLLMRTDEIEDHVSLQDYLNDLSPQSPEVKDLQVAIRENPVLTKELKAQDVEIRNVIYADEAADGSFVLYMR
ncbi:hypothetical protein SAMN05880590_101131 [Rhizobium sp. RU35A]|uniref:hypothetical protein n=1 Tax=Rhizobium sp. RU35A TaxID=1907414 RepID=UPI00095599A4|nr:hypothetical protein [Rhizobium sp. RU35A]SIP90697.1 hypothetical protein SAMN05880590_101131 [Rhizobium sp. RU35A]